MTRPSRMERGLDLDANFLLNNREFQEVLQEYFQNNTMTLDEFLENLPRFMMENYGINVNEEAEEEEEAEAEAEEEEEIDLDDDDAFMAYLRRSSGFRAQPLDNSELLLRSLLTGRREIPLRNILPRSPPPSPVPNIVNTAASIPFFQRNRQMPPQVPSRPGNLRRVPSQLRRSTSLHDRNFDPNAPEDCKSPTIYSVEASPIDRNNVDDNMMMPITSAYLNRYGHSSVVNFPRTKAEDAPER